MNELIKVTYENDRPAVSARDLHEFLEVETDFRHWFPRMCEYGFSEGQDFNAVKNDRVQMEGSRMVTRTVDDAILSIDMAKELCMLQRNEKGKIARQYFIQLEKDWNSPEKVMARALVMAQKKLADLDERNRLLEIDNSRLTASNQIMQPKADYFDELVDRNLLTNFRQTAKELKVKEKVFVNFLINKNYIYRDTKGKLMPRAGKSTDLFEVKETFNEKTQWSGVQTLITPKGRETFRLLLQGERNE